MNAQSQELSFCTGYGQSDTHAAILGDGRPNPHRSAGEPYATVTAKQLGKMVEAPPSLPKDQAQWFIPSTYHGPDARCHDVQRRSGAFWWLAIDIDKGSPTLEAVKTALTRVVGHVARVIYSSRSATPTELKWRVLLPLSAPLGGEDYADSANALYDLLEQEGIVCDRPLGRPGQLVYLPNRGEHYEHDILRAARLSLGPDHPITVRRDATRARLVQAEMEAQARRDRMATERAKRLSLGETSPIDHFNGAHSIEQLLGRYGYTHLRGTSNWRSPMQSSGSFATRGYEDHWVSLSGSDAAAGIGAESKGGARFGDAFDLFVHFEHGGDTTTAVRAYAEEAGLSSAPQPDISAVLRSNSEPNAGADHPYPSEDEAAQDLSHDALALELGQRSFDQDARYVATWGKWLFWRGTHWHIDEALSHMTRTRDFLRDEAKAVTAVAEQEAARLEAEKGEGKSNKLRSQAEELARTLRSKHTVASVEALARSNTRSVARAEDFDSHRMLLGTPDGTVDLTTGTLRPAARSDMITKQTTCGPAPPGSRPVLWLRFLREIFDGDEDLVAFMQRAAGYALTGMTTEHKLLFLYGTGRNGKSVFLNTLTWLWSDYSRRVAAEAFLNSVGEKHPTALAGLQGARLAAGSELPVGKTWDESVIKDLTGGDVMTARYMRGDFFDFEPHLTLMIAGNNQPSFRGVDEAIRARVVLVPFTVTIPAEKRDPDLPEKLKAEGPAILRWAIDGALEWQKRGLDVPPRVAAASEEYMDDEDMLGQFLAERTTQDPDGFVTTTDLYENFKLWCECAGLNSWTLRTMQKEMKSRGWGDHRRRYGRGFLGLRLGG